MKILRLMIILFIAQWINREVCGYKLNHTSPLKTNGYIYGVFESVYLLWDILFEIVYWVWNLVYKLAHLLWDILFTIGVIYCYPRLVCLKFIKLYTCFIHRKPAMDKRPSHVCFREICYGRLDHVSYALNEFTSAAFKEISHTRQFWNFLVVSMLHIFIDN